MKKALLSALVVALLVGQPLVSRAQNKSAAAGESKPIAIISIAGYDSLIGDIGLLGALSNTPGLDKGLEMQIKLLTGGQGLKGLDTKRPWGAVFSSVEDQKAAIFIPVTDLKALLGSLAGVVGPAQPSGDGTFQVSAGPQPLFIKEQGGWAFASNSLEALKDLPKDPVKLLEGLDKEYGVAVRLNIQSIPEYLRTMFVDQMEGAMSGPLQRVPGEDEDQFQLRTKMAKNQIKQFKSLVKELDQFTFGWKLDQKSKSTYLDVQMSAVPGTKMAEQLSAIIDTTSKFAGFMSPTATADANFSSTVALEDAAQFTATLDAMRAQVLKEIDKENDLPTAEAKKTAKEIVEQLLKVAKDTVEKGKMDGGANFVLNQGATTLIAGVGVANPKDVEAALKKFVDLVKDEPEFPKIKFDAAKHGDVRFHTASIPVPDPQGVQVFGKTLDVAVGIGTDSVYLAVGTGSLDKLQKAIDASASASSQKNPPMRMNVALGPILSFAAKTDSSNPILGMLVGGLAQASGKDHVRVVVKPGKNAVTYRIEAEEAVINLIGSAIKLQAGGPPGGVPGNLQLQ